MKSRNSDAYDGVPFSMQPGRIEDFVQGMRDASAQRAKGRDEALGAALGVLAVSALRRRMKRRR